MNPHKVGDRVFYNPEGTAQYRTQYQVYQVTQVSGKTIKVAPAYDDRVGAEIMKSYDYTTFSPIPKKEVTTVNKLFSVDDRVYAMNSQNKGEFGNIVFAQADYVTVAFDSGPRASLHNSKVLHADQLEGIVAQIIKREIELVQPDTNTGTFIIWNPESNLPPKQTFDSEKQATAVAEKMAAKNPGKTFKVAKLVVESVVSGVVTKRL